MGGTWHGAQPLLGQSPRSSRSFDSVRYPLGGHCEPRRQELLVPPRRNVACWAEHAPSALSDTVLYVVAQANQLVAERQAAVLEHHLRRASNGAGHTRWARTETARD